MKTNSAGKITSLCGLFQCRSPPFVRLWTLPSAETGRTGIHHMRDDAVHGWAFCWTSWWIKYVWWQNVGSVLAHDSAAASGPVLHALLPAPMTHFCSCASKFPRPLWRCIIFPATFSEITSPMLCFPVCSEQLQRFWAGALTAMLRTGGPLAFWCLH